MTQMEAATFVRELREAFAQLDSLPMPTVACVDGCEQEQETKRCCRSAALCIATSGQSCGW
jgi:hypothetical protein